MADDGTSSTHCPSCGKQVDKLRAGAVGIFSGKMSYFCSRECRDRFSSSGRDAAPKAGPAPVSRPGPGGPPSPGETEARPEPMLPLLVPQGTAGTTPAALEETGSAAGPDAPALPLMPIAGPDPAPVRSQLPRWIASAAAGGIAILAVHLALGRGWLDGGQLLAIGLLIPAGLVGILHAMFEWRATSLLRALDEVIVVCAVLVCAVPGVLALGRGDAGVFGTGVLLPLAVLVVVWSARSLEAFLQGGLERDLELAPVHADATIGRLFGQPGEYGRSRMARASRRIALALTFSALPAALVIILGSWLVTGRPGVAHHWSIAAAVALSMSPRLLRNILPPVLSASLLRARRAGILFQQDRAFEKAGRVDAVVLRKRGVLLEPGREVVEFHLLGELSAEIILALVASCEEIAAGDELAEALMRHARREGVKPGDTRMARHLPSRGIHSTSPFGELFVGNRLFLIENGISVGRGETVAMEAEKRGNTAVFISINRSVEAVAVLSNRLRPSGKQAVETFHRLGLTTILITGDSTRTAESIGSWLGVDQIRPELACGSREEEVGRLGEAGLGLAILGSVAGGPPRGGEGDLRVGLGWDGEYDVDAGWDVAISGDDLERAALAIELARSGRRLLLVNWALAVLAGAATFGFAASGLASPLLAGLIVSLASAVMMVVRPRVGSTD